jgi:hypothetical protein
MKRKFSRIMIAISLLLVHIIVAECTAKTVNDPTLPAGYVILDRQTGNNTSDGKPRDILLIGRKPNENSNYADDLSLIILDETNSNPITVKLPNVCGYDSKLFVGDFNGDKTNDVLVTIPTGGSGGIVEHRIITLSGEPKIIFGSAENKGIVTAGRFVEGFKFQLRERYTERTVAIDLINKMNTYVKANLYDNTGKLLRQENGSVNPFGELKPLDVGHDGIFELRGQQRITGMYNADTVGYIYSIWKYENGEWVPKQIEVSSVILGFGEE